VQKKNTMKQQYVEENQKFKETWKSKLSDINSKEKDDEEFRKELLRKNQIDLKRQMEEKQGKRESEIRKEFE
jgi:hypothetical protein